MYDRFKRLAAEKGMYMSDCAKEMGITPSTISNWKRRGNLPNGELTIRMADYFGVSCDRILGHKEVTDSGNVLTAEETELLNTYNSLSLNEQNMVRRLLGLKEKERSSVSEVG